jgi:hypothetical protein
MPGLPRGCGPHQVANQGAGVALPNPENRQKLCDPEALSLHQLPTTHIDCMV